MKQIHSHSRSALLALMLCAPIAASPVATAAHLTDGMKEGSVTLQSAGPLAFGPEGILFVADTKGAAIVAIATGDTKPARENATLKIEGINQKVAAMLGTTADEILINDMVINPISRLAYLAVARGRGPDAKPVLVRTTVDGQLEALPTEKVRFSRGELPDAPVDGVEGQANRQSNPRQESITDIAFLEDRILVAGLSNEEFSSTLRAIPFPFKTVGKGTSVEIYHGAHGRFETRAPVRTFVPFKVGNEPQLLAAYTCTPLVQFPIKDLTPGAKIKGKTVAELGNRNRPLDMIVYQKDGKDYLLLANSSRGIMKIDAGMIEGSENIAAPVRDGATKGVRYETIESWKGVDQLDRFDSQHAAVLRRGESGALNLESLPLP
jgi:hypothetical protein